MKFKRKSLETDMEIQCTKLNCFNYPW